MKSWTVYKHISPSEKIYVGISSNVKNRWAANGYYYHLSDTAFSRALKKYGWDNFQHIIIAEDLTKAEACDMERELIAYYKAKGISYNTTDGGEGYYGKHSEEHCKHIREAIIANNDTEYLVIDKDFNYTVFQTQNEVAAFLGGVQRNISHILRQPIGYTFRKHYIWRHRKGTPINIEAIKYQTQRALMLRHQKMSENGKLIGKKGKDALRKTMQNMSSEERKVKYGHGDKLKGRHHSAETKKRMSFAAKGRDMSKAIEARKQMPYIPTHTKPVIQYLITGELVKEYSSITQAAIETGTNAKGIHNCLSKRSNTSGGYKWQYKN